MSKDKFDKAASIASIVLVGILLWQTFILQGQFNSQNDQTKILQTEFTEKERPWIAVEGISEYSPNKVQFDYTNYGSSPDTHAKVLAAFSKTLITRESLEKIPFLNIEITLPNQHQHLPLDTLDPNYFQQVKSGAPLYVAFVIKYDFHNKEHGEYGYIAEYVPGTTSFSTVNSWAS